MAVVIGILLGVIFDGLLETWWISHNLAQGVVPKINNNWDFASYLPWQLSLGILALGLAFGFQLGFWGWRVVYIEKRHWRNRK